MYLTDWITAIAAAVSVAGAAFAWLWANYSNKARREAKEAKTQANETLTAIKALSEDLRRMANTLERPPLIIEPGATGNSWRLRNQSTQTILIEEVLNKPEFVRLDRLPAPCTLEPGQVCEFLALGAWGQPTPPSLMLKTTGNPDSLHVPFPA